MNKITLPKPKGSSIKNQELTRTLAKQYSNHGVPLSKLIEAGNIGLKKAQQRLPKHKVHTYAPWFIRLHMLHEINQK